LFTDPAIPAGYAPFNIQELAGQLYVTYAKQDAALHDDVAGQGHGFVDVFTTDGALIRRLVSHGQLNSPWGLALAPAGFGGFGGALLVGNFGDGHINAYNPDTGTHLGQLRGAGGHPIVIDGLWALWFGNGNAAKTGELPCGRPEPARRAQGPAHSAMTGQVRGGRAHAPGIGDGQAPRIGECLLQLEEVSVIHEPVPRHGCEVFRIVQTPRGTPRHAVHRPSAAAVPVGPPRRAGG
jgi:hypothetical protein